MFTSERGKSLELPWAAGCVGRPTLTGTVRSTDVGELGCVVAAGQAAGELKEAVELPDTASRVPAHLVHRAGVKMCHRLHSTGNWLEGNQRTVESLSLHP